jgi:hypothetical protein
MLRGDGAAIERKHDRIRDTKVPIISPVPEESVYCGAFQKKQAHKNACSGYENSLPYKANLVLTPYVDDLGKTPENRLIELSRAILMLIGGSVHFCENKLLLDQSHYLRQ